MAKWKVAEATGFRVHPDEALDNLNLSDLSRVLAYTLIKDKSSSEINTLRDKLKC